MQIMPHFPPKKLTPKVLCRLKSFHFFSCDVDPTHSNLTTQQNKGSIKGTEHNYVFHRQTRFILGYRKPLYLLHLCC